MQTGREGEDTTRTGTTRKMQPSRWWHSLKVPSLGHFGTAKRKFGARSDAAGFPDRQGEKHELRKS